MATSDCTTKACTRCGVEYPATLKNFPANKNSKNGLHSWCRSCCREKAAQYRAEDPEKIREATRRSWRKNRAKYAAKDKERHALSYIKNKDKINARNNRYYAKHPEVTYKSKQRRRARKEHLPDTFTLPQWKRCLDYFGHKCVYCGSIEDFWTILAPDHWIALKDKRPDNPGTVATNIVPACHGCPGIPAGKPCCNNSKAGQDPEVWLIKKFGKRRASQIIKRIKVYFAWVQSQDESELL